MSKKSQAKRKQKAKEKKKAFKRKQAEILQRQAEQRKRFHQAIARGNALKAMKSKEKGMQQMSIMRGGKPVAPKEETDE